jgi:sec-independent protein translocase protein TatA
MLETNDLALIAFGLGPMEMLIVGAIAVLLFGSRLPEVARSLGKSYVEFKKGVGGLTDEVRNVQHEVEQAADTAYYTPEEDDSPVAFDPPPAESTAENTADDSVENEAKDKQATTSAASGEPTTS